MLLLTYRLEFLIFLRIIMERETSPLTPALSIIANSGQAVRGGDE